MHDIVALCRIFYFLIYHCLSHVPTDHRGLGNKGNFYGSTFQYKMIRAFLLRMCLGKEIFVYQYFCILHPTIDKTICNTVLSSSP